jgi:phosphatidylserine synthase
LTDQSRSGRRWAPVLIAALLLVSSGELFLRYSSLSFVKLVCVAAVVAGLLLLALSGWERRAVAWKLAAVVAVTGYWLVAALRYPGLLKEPSPHHFEALAFFGLKVLLFLIGGTLFLALVGSMVRVLASQAKG